jgi:glycosyltransferase involved in cell wall biosynthesis
MIWKLRPSDYDLVLWTDFQAQTNVWALAFARRLGLYRFKSAFVEHHPPDEPSRFSKMLPPAMCPERIRLHGLTILVLSRVLQSQWQERVGQGTKVEYVPYGLWPCTLPQSRRASARSILGIPAGARVLLIFGVQAVHRKHLDTLLQAAEGFSPQKPLWLLFVGASLGNEPHPFSNWKGHGVEVRIENSFVSEELVETYFAATDAVWANYRNFPGASGVLLHAMGFGRLSLSANEGEIGALCKEHHLGVIVESESPQSLRDTLAQFVDMPEADQVKWEHDVAVLAQQYAWPEMAQQLLEKTGFTLTPCVNLSHRE